MHEAVGLRGGGAGVDKQSEPGTGASRRKSRSSSHSLMIPFSAGNALLNSPTCVSHRGPCSKTPFLSVCSRHFSGPEARICALAGLHLELVVLPPSSRTEHAKTYREAGAPEAGLGVTAVRRTPSGPNRGSHVSLCRN